MREVPAQIAVKLQSAIGVIAEQGLERTKIDEIAEASGVPKATIYYYFAGKEEVLAFLLEDMLTEIADESAIAMESQGDAASKLTAVLTVQIGRLVANPELSSTLVGELGRIARNATLIERLQNAFYTPLVALVEEGAADGSLRQTMDATVTAAAICGAITTSLLVSTVAPSQDETIPEDLAGKLIDVVLNGLKPAG